MCYSKCRPYVSNCAQSKNNGKRGKTYLGRRIPFTWIDEDIAHARHLPLQNAASAPESVLPKNHLRKWKNIPLIKKRVG